MSKRHGQRCVDVVLTSHVHWGEEEVVVVEKMYLSTKCMMHMAEMALVDEKNTDSVSLFHGVFFSGCDTPPQRFTTSSPAN